MATPLYDFSYRGVFIHFSDTQQERGEAEVDQQGEGIHDGGDEGRGHHRRVKADLFSQQRQHTAYDLGGEHGAHQRQADDGGYGDGDGIVEYHPVQQHQLGKVGAGQNGAAQQRHPALLPDHLDQVGKFDLSQRQAADHCDAGLRAAVAAGVHQHGDIGGEDGEGAEGVLKAGDDLAGKGGGDHQ